MTILTTKRLRLEPLADEHFDGLRTVNADPEVMHHLRGRPETPEETASMIRAVKARWAAIGYSWWGFIELDSGAFVGAGCVQNLRREPAPDPDLACPLEVGWRLRRDRWHRGLATEAAHAMAHHACTVLGADPLLAVCVPENTASSAVMQRLGMIYRGLERWYGRELATYMLAPGAAAPGLPRLSA